MSTVLTISFFWWMKTEKEATILVHSKREDPFNRIPKDVAENSRLSFQARGVMAYLIGKPTGWRINVWDLVKRSPHGKTFIRSILNELRVLGYMKLEQRRNEVGEFEGYQWLLSDEPTWFNDSANKSLRESYLRKCSASKRPKKFLRADLDSPTLVSPDTENRTLVRPTPVKRPLNKKEGQEEVGQRRKNSASAVRTRTSKIRALPGVDDDSRAPAALAPFGALELCLPDDLTAAERKLALESPECVRLLQYWLGNYKAVFGMKPPTFSAADIDGALDLVCMEIPVDDIFAAIVMAWAKPSAHDPQAHNPYWACNHYCRSLADMAKKNRGQNMTNFQRMMLEMDWRAKRSQVETAWSWLEQAHRGRAGLPLEEAEEGVVAE